MAKPKPWESKIPDKQSQLDATNKKRIVIGLSPKAQAAAKPTAIGLDLGAEDDTAFVAGTVNNGTWKIVNFNTRNCSCSLCKPQNYPGYVSQLQSYQQAVINQYQSSLMAQVVNQQNAISSISGISNQYQAYVNSQQYQQFVNNNSWLNFVNFIQSEIIHFDPDPAYPDTLGWRCWDWIIEKKQLISPVMDTIWHNAELRCETYDQSKVIRGCAGIHARIVPLNWEKEKCPEGSIKNGFHYFNNFMGPSTPAIQIDGLVERFGKYVLGTEGWRTEWAIIRKLKAPSLEIGLELEKQFPDVEIIYTDKETEN